MNNLSLWDHELRLARAIDDLAQAEEMGREPDETALIETVREYALEAAEKRDKMAWFLQECEDRAGSFRAEIYRMQRRQKALENAAERLRNYIVSVMETMGLEKIEGTVTTWSLAKNPDRVSVEGEVPAEFQRVTIEPDKIKIKDALQEGKAVPNCRLVPGKNRLVIR